MLSYSLAIVAAATGALAATPSGFQPGAQTELIVMYGDVAAQDGNVIARADTQEAPMIGTQEKLAGSSYTVIMIDLDIPTNSPPQTNTLLHWMQMGFSPASEAMQMEGREVFMLEAGSGAEAEAAAASYIGPNPPARFPLSHRYTEILVDTSDVQEQAMNALMSAAQTRMGFNAMEVLKQAGLMDKIVAGNFFNVTNQGNSSTSSVGGGNGSGTTSSPQPSSTFATGSGMALGPQLTGIVGLVVVAAMFLGF